MKADFTSMVAHELASPLLAVRSFAEVLAGDDLRPEERARMLAKLHEQADGLGVLVEDVRASATAERGGFAIAPRQVTVAELLSEGASYAEALPGGHRLSLVDETDGMRVLADPGRIAQVLHNLLSNAAKYSPAGSETTLRAEPVPGERRVRFSVSDRGSGIHPDDLERVFEKFGRGREPDGQRVGGVGLGLYLSRQIVRSHGSDLTVSSVPGEGSVFAFELEASRAGRVEQR
jgi:signal transduction histidine kinase